MLVRLREVIPSDYESFMKVLSELSDSRGLTKAGFEDILKELHTTYVTVALVENKIVGTGSLYVRYNFSHAGRPVGLLENLVVAKEYRKHNVGTWIVQRIIDQARKHNCYSLILNCKDDLIGYYQRFVLTRSGNQMRLNLP
jgi:glucosamine-phosphate N-acetyltransferase